MLIMDVDDDDDVGNDDVNDDDHDGDETKFTVWSHN